MNRFLHIARYPALVALLLLLVALAPARAQEVTYQNVVYQGDITTFSVDSISGETYSWEIYNDSTVNFAKVPGACPTTLAGFIGDNAQAKVNIEWRKPGVYFVKVTSLSPSGCTNNLKVSTVLVLEFRPTAKLITTPICEGDPVKIKVELTGKAPWSFTITDGTKTWTASGIKTKDYEITISPGPKLPTSYWVTLVTDKWGINIKPSDPVEQVVNPKPASSPIYLYD
jgi:hypothetical protein